ncbi:hypothetical protein Q4S45_10495 [Massilia sp. R2A-15]|uniref:hypothetical protein n=1 Tax=Massilia sp. R2A-15 TaxID=3064278 RepID=UPI002732811D|nr:hypothetical protein [Massilia sp. R2A-15]WLI91521.1 hypothetical protein Q4S45_10495 [Massilia sp. R2A-15]
MYPDQVCAVIQQRRFGQTAAMQAGIDAAQGSIMMRCASRGARAMFMMRLRPKGSCLER